MTVRRVAQGLGSLHSLQKCKENERELERVVGSGVLHKKRKMGEREEIKTSEKLRGVERGL